jgi:hypothetical protein
MLTRSVSDAAAMPANKYNGTELGGSGNSGVVSADNSKLQSTAGKPSASPGADDKEHQQGPEAQQQQQQQQQGLLPSGEELEAILMAQLLGAMQSSPAAATSPFSHAAHINNSAAGLDIMQQEALLNLYLQSGAAGATGGGDMRESGVQGHLGAGHWLNTAGANHLTPQLLSQQLLHTTTGQQQLQSQAGPSTMLTLPHLQQLMQGLSLPKGGSPGLGGGPEAVGRTWDEVSPAVRDRVEQVVASSGGYIRVGD